MKNHITSTTINLTIGLHRYRRYSLSHSCRIMQEPIHNAILNPLQLGTEYLDIPFELQYFIILIFTYFLHLIDLVFKLKRPFDQQLVFLYEIIAFLPKFRNFFVQVLKGIDMCGSYLGQ
jgi:hypothetical protein